ncbi:MAG: DUF3489 domain-containing protein [Sterolibacterium sp.]
MTTSIKLTDAQRHILEHAAGHPEGSVTNQAFPDNIKGGARTKVIASLFSKAFVSGVEIFDCFITDAGYAALGCARPAPAASHPDPQIEAAVVASEATWAQEKQEAAQRLLKTGVEGKPRLRDNSKQATVIEMLQRPNGATINEICEATGWQAHTVRGTFAGALKKKLGLDITSFKDTGASRVYRIL